MEATPAANLDVTGERVTALAGGFKPTWERHVAAYMACSNLVLGYRTCSNEPIRTVHFLRNSLDSRSTRIS